LSHRAQWFPSQVLLSLSVQATHCRKNAVTREILHGLETARSRKHTGAFLRQTKFKNDKNGRDETIPWQSSCTVRCRCRRPKIALRVSMSQCILPSHRAAGHNNNQRHFLRTEQIASPFYASMSTSELQLEPQHVNGGPPGCAAAHAEDAHVLEEPLPQEQPLPPPPPVGKADVVSPLTSAGSSGSDETTGSASELGAGDPAEPMHEAVTAEVAVATESSPAAAQDGAEEAPQRQKEVVPNETLRDGAPTPLAQLPTPATTSASSLSSQTDMSSISGGNSSSTVSISHSTTRMAPFFTRAETIVVDRGEPQVSQHVTVDGSPIRLCGGSWS